MLKKFTPTPTFVYLLNSIKAFNYLYFFNLQFIFFLNFYQIKIKIFNNFKTNFLKISSNQWNVRQKFKGLKWKLKKKSIVNTLSSFKRKVKKQPTWNIKYAPFKHSSYSLLYSAIFYKNWNFLVGNLISPFYWDFLSKKKQYNLINKIHYKFNKYAKSLKRPKSLKYNKINKKSKSTLKSSTNINYKKTPALLMQYNKYFSLRNSTVRFAITARSAFSRNKTIFSKPYFFFQNPSLLATPFENTIDRISNSFWKRMKTFSILKSNLVRVVNYSDALTIFNQYYKIIGHFKKYANLDYLFIRDKNIGNIFITYPKKLHNVKKKNIKIKLTLKKFILKKWRVCSIYLSRIVHKRNWSSSVRNRTSLLPKSKLFKKINNILSWNTFIKKINNYKSFKKINFKNNSILKKNIRCRVNNNAMVLPLRFKTSNIIRFFFFKKLPLRLLNNRNKLVINFENLAHNYFASSFIFKKLKKPVFVTFEKTLFSSDIDGFVYLNNYESNNLTVNKIYNLKRISYSFVFKNEIHKYILKKYSKIVWAGAGDSHELIPFFINKTFNSHKGSSINELMGNKFLKSQLSIFNDENLISKKWNFFRNQAITQYDPSSYSSELMINRIRFKPGYASQWRAARSVFKLIQDLKIRYQYRLTRYLMRYLKIKSSNFFLLFELELQNILMRSRLIPDKNLVFILLQRNVIYVNGRMSNNGKLQLTLNDFVQLIVSLKYYIIYKQLINWSLKKKSRLRRIIFSKIPSESETEDKKKSDHLPNWILTNEGVNEDVIKFAEIDYFTLSIFIVYEPFTWRELNTFNILRYRPITLRLYNWKYIT